jgi:putative ABC transport system permease protein
MEFIRLIFKNTLRNPRRTVLTVLSIGVSIFLVSTLQAVLNSLYRAGHSSSSPHLRVVVHRATSITQSLPEADRERIAEIPGVKYVVGVTWFGGEYKDPSNFFANFAADTDNFEKVYDDYKIPPDELAAWKRERIAALVGETLMKRYHWKIGDRVTLKSNIYPLSPEFVIRAVYTDPSDPSQAQSFFFHYDYFDELMGRPGQVGTFTVKVDSAQDVPKVMTAIDAAFHNTAAETKTETEQAFALSFATMLGNVKLLLGAISAAVIFTILLVVGNTMAISIRERTSEVAVLKTLGFSRRTILSLLVGEAILIAVLGGLAGGLGAMLTYAFVRSTINISHGFGLVLGVVTAALAGWGAWALFGGPSATAGWLKGVRYVATVLGAIVGLAVGFGFYIAAGFVVNVGGFFADFGVSWATLALCLLIAGGVGLVSSALPALRAARVSIAEALRFVG